MSNKLTRRDFLRISSLAAGSAALASCAKKATDAPAPDPGVTDAPVPAVTDAPMVDFSGSSLEMIMRNSFIPEMNQIQQNQIAQWAADNGVEVEPSFAREWREMYTAAVEAGTGDICELFGNMAHVFGDKLMDVSALCEELGDSYGGWYDVAKEVSIVDGVWRTIPRAYTAHAFNYRTDYFDAVGYPDGCETYDDFLDAATKLKEQGLPLVGNTVSQTGPNDSASFCYSLLWSFGAGEVDESGVVAINSAETRAACEWMQKYGEVADPGITGYDEGGNNRAFQAGEISCTQNATSIYWNTRTQAPDVFANMSHFKYPAGPGGYHQLVEMNTLSIFEHSENKDAALALLTWLMDPIQLVPLMQVGITFYTPLLYAYDDNPAMPWNIDEKLIPLKGLAEGGHMPGYPALPTRESGEAYENQTIVNMFAAVLAGTSIEDAITTAEAELKTVYG